VVFDGNVISIKTAALQKAARLETLTTFFFLFIPAILRTGMLPSTPDFLGLNK